MRQKLDDYTVELFTRKVELRIVDNLWKLAEEIKLTTFDWPLCRMSNAKESITLTS